MTRRGWAYTVCPPFRVKPTSVRPEASATRTASAVGPEIAARSGAPRTQVFCTISKLARLVTTTKPSSSAAPAP